ncbi:hypothetical protein EOD41_15205 [Mucilaginibacter limnophilus]|uniref:Uncharacterized protein n=1 Tax=Mucilaginibacter limnophilus TaxID=1932778 RepID=A0A437MQ61_9SPHI|nr:hypothetical protein [Mucilaginibacter limnophilus]RVT99788.1 hypothetical protein EOD41_15205 [Mucilaginibacter limnophilus]
MEDIIKFRIFLSFPLFGLLIPDMGLYLTGASASFAMPGTHIIIVVTLLICIAVLTAGITYYKRKHEITAEPNGSTNNTPVFEL